MKLTSKILLILVLLLGIAFVVQIAGLHGAYVSWADRAQIEERKIGDDISLLNMAYSDYLAARAEADQIPYGPDAQEVIALKAQKNILRWYRQEAVEANDQVKAAYDALNKAISDVSEEVPAEYKKIVDALRTQVQERAGTKANVEKQVADLLANIASSRAEYALDYQEFVLLEYNQYLTQEDLHRTKETLYRYRWLRPDLQAQVGDTGHMVTANVIAATPLAVIIDKGKRDGVELYQKFTVQREGRMIAIVDIVEVRNDEAEGEVRHLTDKQVRPQPGDTVVPQTFVGGFGTALADR
ncbi:MAG: hypothetical protein L6Q71_01430 [Planctomycetes bacterium]|nr:hypothetical protein [Planctomycetota bacterium]NUQ35936.1 hypothetical protein [Planctomycetaceae bacterium]